jgi:hypothetical protein
MADFAIPTNQREFRCMHCNGKILIPKELPPTTGPCPHCSGVITSPALETAAAIPAFQMPAAPVAAIPVAPAVEKPPVEPPRAAVTRPPAPPVKIEEPEIAPIVPLAPEPTVEVKPQRVEIPPKSPASPVNHPKKKNAPKEPKPPRSGLIPVLLVLFLLLLGGGAAVYFVSKDFGKNLPPPPPAITTVDPAISEANYLRIGWQKDAYQILRGYLDAKSADAKLPFILNADTLKPRVEDFYGGGAIIDSDTPADAFSIYELSEEDRKRGLFMMIYDQPPQFDMKEFFRPLASLEVQYGVEEADLLLSTLARVGNFAMEPLRVHAFFKRTPEGLKLDWEIFSQTKYRTFQNFVELPEVGQSAVFRVFVVEDVPEKGRAVAGTRTYRIADPANTGDIARVNVRIDSETGRALSIINWRNSKENHPITRTATVELKWAGESNAPELEISRFICWEFLGLGGQETPATASTK